MAAGGRNDAATLRVPPVEVIEEAESAAEGECDCGVDCSGSGGLLEIGVEELMCDDGVNDSEPIHGLDEEGGRMAANVPPCPGKGSRACWEDRKVRDAGLYPICCTVDSLELDATLPEKVSQFACAVERLKGLEGDSLFIEVVAAYRGLQKRSWENEINALNLRRATIGEIRKRIEFYARRIKPDLTLDEFSDLLTHWNEPGSRVDREICWAVVEVINVNIEVSCDRMIFQYPLGSATTARAVRVREEHGVYHGGWIGATGIRERADEGLCMIFSPAAVLTDTMSQQEEEFAMGSGPGAASYVTDLERICNGSGTDLERAVEVTSECDKSHQAKSAEDTLEIATINCCGCAKEEKRDDIDHQLNKLSVEICGIQETRIIWEELETKNYKWYCSPCESQTSHRGVGMLVRKNSGVEMKGFRTISENICSAWVEKKNIGMILVVVHIPSDRRMPDVFAEIASLLSKIPPEDDFAVIGDFNGRIGRLDVNEEFNGLIGRQLVHEESNENGTFLLQLVMQLRLVVTNTYARSKSVLKTWSNKTVSSQIDHILIPRDSGIRVKKNSLRAVEPVAFNSDHKILKVCFRKARYNNTIQQRRMVNNPKRAWNVKLLSDQKAKDKFAEAVRTGLVQMEQQLDGGLNLECKWNNLKNVLKDAANVTIPAAKKPPMSPRTKKAYSDFQKKRFRLNRFADVERCRFEVKLARDDLEQAKREHVWKTWKDFFDKIQEVEPYLRIKLTYEFLKDHKHQKERKNTKIQVNILLLMHKMEI